MSSDSAPIKVFLRCRPTGRATKSLSLDVEESRAEFNLEKCDRMINTDFVNNSKTNFNFKFDGVFGMEAKQEELFELLSRPVLDDALEGINGCVFAYGQTGSGKTFTITGGVEKYADRGIIPRSIQYLFSRVSSSHSIAISYLEIYNGQGYDLLTQRETNRLEELPKVTLREDEEGAFHLQNLTVNAAPTEEEALNLLFLGDTNRVVAETPMNDGSTRSHCIFVLRIESREPGSELVKRARVYFVDLAGSERVSKSGVDGRLLNESKHINVSLHYLEQVIVALHERSKGNRSHIPYRNSMMTSVLRDALGGNCKTVMVATVSLDDAYVEETISTCRFAQRVALIKNEAVINEETDPVVLIRRLKEEVASLKEEILLLKSADGHEEENILTSEVLEILKNRVSDFVQGKTENLICGNIQKIRAAFGFFKDLVIEARKSQIPDNNKTHKEPLSPRKVEISKFQPTTKNDIYDINLIEQRLGTELLPLLLDRAKAIETFRKIAPELASEISPEDRDTMQRLCVDGRSLGEEANKARNEANRLKGKLESMRVCDAVRSPDGKADETLPEYVEIKAQIEKHKVRYQEATDKLRELKSNVEQIQAIANANKTKVQNEFHKWFTRIRETFSRKGISLAIPNENHLSVATSNNEASADAKQPTLQRYLQIRDQMLNSKQPN